MNARGVAQHIAVPKLAERAPTIEAPRRLAESKDGFARSQAKSDFGRALLRAPRGGVAFEQGPAEAVAQVPRSLVQPHSPGRFGGRKFQRMASLANLRRSGETPSRFRDAAQDGKLVSAARGEAKAKHVVSQGLDDAMEALATEFEVAFRTEGP